MTSQDAIPALAVLPQIFHKLTDPRDPRGEENLGKPEETVENKRIIKSFGDYGGTLTIQSIFERC